MLPTLRKFKDLQVPTGGKELPDAEAIENTTRVLSSPELGAEIAPDNITSIADHKVRSE